MYQPGQRPEEERWSAGSSPGVLSADGSLRFVAAKSGAGTVVSAIRTRDRTTMLTQTVRGQFGIPAVTQSGLAGGLFHDGSALVLQSMGITRTSRFLVPGTEDLAVRNPIALNGIFGFDALSPDGSRLYLIQHLSTDRGTRRRRGDVFPPCSDS